MMIKITPQRSLKRARAVSRAARGTARVIGALGVITLAQLIASSANAIPPRSLTTQARGFVQVNESVPWVAGREVGGAVRNLNALLKEKREAQSAKSVYLLLCHTAVRECSASVRFLHNLRSRFESEEIDVVVIFTEDIEAQKLQDWLALRNVTPSSRFHVLIDRYHRSALRLGAYQEQKPKAEDPATQDAEKTDTSSPRMSRLKHELRVPLGVLMNVEGRVMMIVVQEGADLSERITQTLRYQGVPADAQEEPED